MPPRDLTPQRSSVFCAKRLNMSTKVKIIKAMALSILRKQIYARNAAFEARNAGGRDITRGKQRGHRMFHISKCPTQAAYHPSS